MNALIAALLVSVSAGKDNQLRLYDFNPANGALIERAKIDLPGSPGAQCLSPDGNRLYVAVRNKNSVAAFRINHAKKTLDPLGLTDIGANAAYVSIDRTGRTLLWASYSGGEVGTHSIAQNGAVKKTALSRIKTERCAHAILTDPANRYAYVPHTGPNAVYQFTFDAATGKLTPHPQPKVHPADGLEPRHLAFHPTLPVIYFDDEKGDSVSTYQRSPKTGKLVPIHTASTLPAGFDGAKNTCADIEITADGKFVYASNRGHNSIAAFAVDTKTGRLKGAGQFPTGEVPRSFNLAPGNRWLIAAGQRSHDLHIYRRNPLNGKLIPAGKLPTGQGPGWVQFIPIHKVKK